MRCPVCDGFLLFVKDSNRQQKPLYCKDSQDLNGETHFIGYPGPNKPEYGMTFVYTKNYMFCLVNDSLTSSLEVMVRGFNKSRDPIYSVYERTIDENPFESYERMNFLSSSAFVLSFCLYEVMPLSEITDEYLQNFSIMS